MFNNVLFGANNSQRTFRNIPFVGYGVNCTLISVVIMRTRLWYKFCIVCVARLHTHR